MEIIGKTSGKNNVISKSFEFGVQSCGAGKNMT
jgi:hypothetical protein